MKKSDIDDKKYNVDNRKPMKLEEIFNTCKCNSTEEANLQDFNGKFYNIPLKYVDNFTKRLRESNIYRMKERKEPNHLMFYPKRYKGTQFRFDIDLKTLVPKSDQSVPESLYSSEQAFKFISSLQNKIKELIPNVKKKELTCFLLEKDKYLTDKHEGTLWKNGFHLEFPYLYVTNKTLATLVEEGNEIASNIFDSRFFTKDEGFHHNSWLLYGNCKKDLYDSYKATWKVKLNEEPVKAKTDKNYIKLFWLFPRNETIHYIPTEFNFNHIPFDEEKFQSFYDDDEEDVNEEELEVKNIEEREAIADFYLTMMNDNRVSHTNSWRLIVHSLRQYLGEKGESFTRNWSMQTELNNYTDEGFNKEWAVINNRRGLHTIKYIAMVDNPLLKDLIKNEDQDIASAVHSFFRDTLIMTESCKGYTYDSETTLWNSADPEQIWYHCYPKLIETAQTYEKQLFYLINKLNDKDLIKCMKKELTRAKKTVKKLKTSSIIKRVCTSLGIYRDKTNFIDRLNNERDLFPISKNQVVNLCTKEISERKPEHNFTFTSEVDLTEEREFGDKFFLDLANSDKELCEYLKTLFLYTISGHSYMRGFFQLIGKGMNGKSLYINILEQLLQHLSYPPSKDQFVCDKKSFSRSSGPQPELRAMKGKRMLVCCETQSGDLLNTGNLKKITGGDSLSARDCNSNDVSPFRITGTVLIASNYQLEHYENDKAVHDRTFNVPFLTRFDKNEQFKDDILSNKDGKLNSIFSSALEGGCIYLQQHTFPKCKIVEESTQRLLDELDTVQQFINECCIIEGNDLRVNARQLYTEYKQFCRENGIESMKTRSFKQDMEQKGFEYKALWLNKSTQRCYFGIMLNTLENEDEEEKEEKIESNPVLD